MMGFKEKRREPIYGDRQIRTDDVEGRTKWRTALIDGVGKR